MKKYTIYCLSGLGADHRVFGKLKLDAELIHIPWLTPQRDESREVYLKRITEGIVFKSPYILMGLSFGGMMLRELLKENRPEGVILISTAVKKMEIPFLWRLILATRILEWIPMSWIKSSSSFVLAKLFSLKTVLERRMLKQIIQDTDGDFMHWAFKQIRLWDEGGLNENCVRIHGSKDLLIRPTKNKKIKMFQGGHLIVQSKAQSVSNVINNYLAGLN